MSLKFLSNQTTDNKIGIGTNVLNYTLTTYASTTGSHIVASFGSGLDNNDFTAIGLSGFIASNGATKAGIALKRKGVYGTGELHFLNNTTLDNSDMTLSDSKMMINQDGNLGIGTTTPSSIVSTSGSNTVVYDASSVNGQDSTSTIKIANRSTNANTFASIDFNTNNNRVTNRIVSSHAGTVHTGFLAFVTESYNGTSGVPSEKMRITGTGNVGIGTDNPLDVLHVKNLDAVGGNSRCDIRLENGLGYAEFGVLSNYARIQSNGTEVAALSGNLSLFYGSNWTFGSNLTTVTTDGKLTINSGNGTGGEAYLNLSRNNVSGFILNHTATAIQVRATANIPMFFYTNDTIGIKLNANSTIALPEYGAGYLKTDGSGNVTADATVPGTGTFLPLAGGTMTGTGSIVMPDGFKLQLGNGIFSIFNDGTYSIIRSANEPLLIDSNGITFRGYSPYNTLATITSSGISIKSALLSNQENTDIDSAAAEMVAQVAIADYTAAFFDFVIKKGTNVRSGTVYACHDGTSVVFTETSTNDLGNTSDVTLSVDISGTNMRLLATVTSDDWSVKSLIRAI